jgi:hypothetical protein
MQMRWTVGIVLVVILAAALGVWLGFSPSQVNPNASGAAEAGTAIFPIELHPKAGKDLPDKTVREPF